MLSRNLRHLARGILHRLEILAARPRDMTRRIKSVTTTSNTQCDDELIGAMVQVIPSVRAVNEKQQISRMADIFKKLAP